MITDFVGRWIAPYASVGLAALLAMAGTTAGVQTLRLAYVKTELAVVQRDWATQRSMVEQAAREQVTRFRATEAAWHETQRKALDAVEQKVVQARADSVLADAARGKLQQRVATLVADASRSAASSSIASAGAAAGDAAGVLAELQRSADERAGILARVADERGAAGELCERSYDALTTAP